jgi:NADH dehydrogenase FAD-containing subunit
MNKKVIIWGLVIIGAGVGGYFIYRKIRTSSNSAEKNNRKIKIIGKRNVSAQVEEQGSEANNDGEI